MDDSSIAVRAEQLRREIQLIQQEEHCCRCQRGHSLADNEEHVKREVRILQIREELRALVKRAKQRSSYGSVWFS